MRVREAATFRQNTPVCDLRERALWPSQPPQFQPDSLDSSPKRRQSSVLEEKEEGCAAIGSSVCAAAPSVPRFSRRESSEAEIPPLPTG